MGLLHDGPAGRPSLSLQIRHGTAVTLSLSFKTEYDPCMAESCRSALDPAGQINGHTTNGATLQNGQDSSVLGANREQLSDYPALVSD